MSTLRIFLLGNPRFSYNGADLQFHRRKAIALLAYLVVSNQPHSRDALATLLWPEYDHTSARANLRRELSRLVQVLGNQTLHVERDQIGIDPNESVWLDVAQFNSRIKQAQRHCPSHQQLCSDCTRLLKEAVDMCTGSFMTGFGLSDSPVFDEWQFYQSIDIQHALAWALDVLSQSYADQGEYALAIIYALRWLALDNLNEAAHRALIEFYARAGERSAALRQYQECVKILEDELGVQPEAETVQLAEEIRRGEFSHQKIRSEAILKEVELGAGSKMVMDSINASAFTIPQPPTPFIGREAELEKIATLLNDPNCRLLTLLGQGGAGKTRLAIQAAQFARAYFPHGVVFIPLAALDPSQSILPGLLSSLGLISASESETGITVLVNYLRARQILFVLDSFEQLITNADLLGDILTRTEHTKFLITSRQRLNLLSEWVLDVGGLAYPAERDVPGFQRLDQQNVEPISVESYGAVQLFLASAQRVQARFQPTGSERLSVARIAQLVEGVPLALELAAGWINVLSCEEIAEEIAASLDILETTSPDVPERQRSLRAVFDHSWELLSEREKQIFPCLSVFRGGFSRRAALDITGISLQELGGLVDKSLVVRKTDGQFELHELVRQYAVEKLRVEPDKYSEIQVRHCIYYCAVLKHKIGILKGPQQPEALNEIQADYGNFRAAWYWAASNKLAAQLDDAIESLCLYCLRRGRYEEGENACRYAAEQLENLDQADDLRIGALLLAWRGTFLHFQGNFAEAGLVFQRSQAILESGQLQPERTMVGRALVARGKGILANFAGDAAQARRYYTESLAMFQGAGDQFYASDVLFDLAINLQHIHNRPLEAKEHFQKSLEIKRAIGDQQSLAYLVDYLGVVSLFDYGQIEEALSYFEESQKILSSLTGINNIAHAFQSSMYISYIHGQYEKAIEMAEKALAIFEELGERRSMIISLGMITECLLCLGEYRRAEVKINHALELLSIYDEQDIQSNMYRWVLASIYLATGRFIEAKSILQTCVQISRQVVGKHSLGRDLAVLSLVEHALGEITEAWMHALEALRLFLRYRHQHWYLYGLASLAVLLVGRKEYERAVEIYANVHVNPLVKHSQWFTQVCGRWIDVAADKMTAEIFLAAQERGQQQDMWMLGEKLLEELEGR